MDTVVYQLDMIDRFTKDENATDYDRAVTYCSNILTNCPASIRHNALKCEYLLRASHLAEASKFSKDLMSNPDMAPVPLIQSWMGRILCYSGNEIKGKKVLQDALRVDPDLTDAMKTLKLLKVAASRKEEASEIFKANEFEQAILAFDGCLEIDPLNLAYNSTICLNKAIC